LNTRVRIGQRDDLPALMQTRPKDVVPANPARQLAGVYVMLLSGRHG
jgi:hypothetical protein